MLSFCSYEYITYLCFFTQLFLKIYIRVTLCICFR